MSDRALRSLHYNREKATPKGREATAMRLSIYSIVSLCVLFLLPVCQCFRHHLPVNHQQLRKNGNHYQLPYNIRRGYPLSSSNQRLDDIKIDFDTKKGSDKPTVQLDSSSQASWRLLCLGVTIIWSTNFAVIKSIFDAVPEIDSSLYAAIRFDIAALALSPLTAKYWSWEHRDIWLRGVSIGCSKFFGFLGQAIGLRTSTANKAAFFCSLNVVWVATLTSFRDGKFKASTWMTILIAILGAAILELNGSTAPNSGDFFLLMQPIGFGGAYFLLDSAVGKHHYRVIGDASEPGTEKQLAPSVVDAGALMGFAMLTVACICTAWAALSGHSLEDLQPIYSSPTALTGLAYTGLFTTAAMVYLQGQFFKEIPATDASLILSTEPVFAAAFASSLLGEFPSPTDYIGGSLIVFACLSNELKLFDNLSFDSSKTPKNEK